jgi:uncharacterized Fe-S cluster-containing MiaB family protein
MTDKRKRHKLYFTSNSICLMLTQNSNIDLSDPQQVQSFTNNLMHETFKKSPWLFKVALENRENPISNSMVQTIVHVSLDRFLNIQNRLETVKSVLKGFLNQIKDNAFNVDIPNLENKTEVIKEAKLESLEYVFG